MVKIVPVRKIKGFKICFGGIADKVLSFLCLNFIIFKMGIAIVSTLYIAGYSKN